MKTINIVLCGLGGQGILFMTKLLAQAILDKGYNIIGSETHGMAQRGGSVTSHLRFGEAQSSMVRSGTAHLLLSLDENECYRNLAFLSRGGKMYVNTDPDNFPRPAVKGYLEKREIAYRTLPASVIAQECGAPRSSNLALLGFFSAFDDAPVTYAELSTTIEKLSPMRFKDLNHKVFEAGHNIGLDCR
jgi:indolepyruvate ferredoxin oxidoreductase beta subunit